MAMTAIAEAAKAAAAITATTADADAIKSSRLRSHVAFTFICVGHSSGLLRHI